MSSGRFYLIESENPEKVLEMVNKKFLKSEEIQDRLDEAKSLFDVPEEDIEFDIDYTGELIDEDRVCIRKNIGRMPDSRKNPEEFAFLSNIASRLLHVSWSDTSDTINAELFNITENGLKKVDEEDSRLRLGEEPISEESSYQGYSHLPSYFYHRHDFKMFDRKRDSENIDYQKLYTPENHPDEEYTCQICNSNNISQNGWDFKCRNCGYKETAPHFRDHDSSPYLYLDEHHNLSDNDKDGSKNTELPNSEEKNNKLRKIAFKVLKHAVIVLSLITLLILARLY